MSCTNGVLKFESKLILVGESNVGKSTLLNRQMTGELNKNIATTFGSGFQTKVNPVDVDRIKEENVELQLVMDDLGVKKGYMKLFIWDTAGQEKFRSISQMYFKSAQAAIIMFDRSNLVSYEKVKGWLHDLRTYANQPVNIVIAGNKQDLETDCDMEDVNKFCGMNDFQYFDTSAYTNYNVEELFEQISQELYVGQMKREFLEKNNGHGNNKVGIGSSLNNKKGCC